MASQDEVKAQARARFGQFAQGYVESESHASGEDLEQIAALAQIKPDACVLDVATGGGHTALKMAASAKNVIAADLTPKMLHAARTFIQAQGIYNVAFAASDAEQLAFADATFDVVTCRIAPHHFPDCFHFVQECARVLKTGGRLVVEDHVMPDDERAARYIDSLERLRDPSHYRAFADYEWQGMFLDAGLVVEHVEKLTKADVKLVPWAERQGCTPAVIERLQVMLRQAPEAVAAAIHPQYSGTADAAFDHHYIIIVGSKP
ncbi:MAG: class I SAM-dependent methyltransferase [Chloroflexota bacterium]